MTITKNLDGSSRMQLIAEDLARAHMATRLEEARRLRPGTRLVAVRRLSRKAERARLQARLALARML